MLDRMPSRFDFAKILDQVRILGIGILPIHHIALHSFQIFNRELSDRLEHVLVGRIECDRIDIAVPAEMLNKLGFIARQNVDHAAGNVGSCKHLAKRD